MSLRDIMSAAGLTTWPQVALVICFAAFTGILIYLFIVRRHDPYDHEAALPLNDEPGATEPPVERSATLSENGHA